MTFYGVDADRKAQKLADAIFAASRRTFKQLGLPDYSETSVELIGAESQFGSNAQVSHCRELVLKIAAKHPEAAGIGILLKEAVGLGLATPPGLSGFAGARPSPSPVVRLFSFALPKGTAQIEVEIDGVTHQLPDGPGQSFSAQKLPRPTAPAAPTDASVPVPLIKLAWGRSGDKGDKANIGILARRPEYLPYIYAELTEQAVANGFSTVDSG